jgi:hypothetical protein
LESLSIAARHILGAALRVHSKTRAWHYGVMLPDDNPNSLCHFLGLSSQQMQVILQVCGLIRKHKGIDSVAVSSMSQKSSVYSWQQFIIENHLNGYFDKMSVAKVTSDTKQHWWIRLGTFEKSRKKESGGDDNVIYNPSSQFRYYKCPPRLNSTGRKVLAARRMQLLSLIKLIDSDDMMVDGEEDKEVPVDEGMSMNNDSMLNDNLRDLAINLLLDLKSGVADIEQAAEELIKAMKKSQFESQMSRMEQIMGREVSEPMVELPNAARKFPLLSSFGVPLCREFISPILREIVLLSDSSPDSNLLTYTTHRGTECTLLNVPHSKNRIRFRRNVRGRQNWLLQLPRLVGPADDEDGSEAAGWILEYLGSAFEDEYVATAETLGYPITSKKMPSEHAAAMWQEANIARRAQRTILRHLSSYFGSRLVVPEAEITKLGQNHVVPDCNSFVYEKKRIHYWTKPLTKAVEVALETRLGEVGADGDVVPKSIDIVVGGDHGKERFRAVAKVIIRDEDGKKVDSFVFKIANIDCKKDTYAVLANSIAPALNHGMKSLVDAGTIEVYRVGGLLKVTVGATVFVDPTASLVYSSPVRVLVSGDLAFFTSVLGKVNMSSHWCMWCNLGKADWAEVGHEKGELWTLDYLVELRRQLDEGEIARNPQSVKGVTDPLLFDSVEIRNYIFSVLHAEIGVGNKVLASFFDWVDFRIEDISEEELAARTEYFQSLRHYDDEAEAWREWTDEFGPQLADLRDQRKILNELKQMRNAANRFLHSVADRREMTEEGKELAQEIKDLEKSKKDRRALVTTADEVVSLNKKVCDSFQRSRGKLSPVRSQLEETLVRNGIERSSYHGGDLTGVHIARFFQKADEIFQQIRTILLEVDGRLANNDEVDDMVRRYTELCTLLDFLFSLARTPSGDATEEVCVLADECVEKVMAKWRDLRLSMLMPKMHGIEDHLVEGMRRFKGIGCFIEDFIEQAHQTGHKDELRTANMRDRKRASSAHSMWEFSTWRSGVIKVKEEVQTKTRRKRKPEDNPMLVAEQRNGERKRQRMEKRLQCLESVSTDPNPIEDYMIRTSEAYLSIMEIEQGEEEAVE